MKSNICKLNEDLNCLGAVLAEVEKVTAYNGLEAKKALRLRLLAEELCGMLPGLTQNFKGEFWAETDGDNYELHVELRADDMDIDLRDELISVSKSGKNAAAKGVKLGRPSTNKENLPLCFLKYYPMYKTGDINITEFSRLSEVSRKSIYKYIKIAEGKE